MIFLLPLHCCNVSVGRGHCEDWLKFARHFWKFSSKEFNPIWNDHLGMKMNYRPSRMTAADVKPNRPLASEVLGGRQHVSWAFCEHVSFTALSHLLSMQQSGNPSEFVTTPNTVKHASQPVSGRVTNGNKALETFGSFDKSAELLYM